MSKEKISIGAHQLSWGTCIASEDVLPRAKRVTELGCGAFEFFLNAGPFPMSEIKDAIEQLELTPIGCAVIRAGIEEDPLSIDEKTRQKSEKTIEFFINRIRAMGGSLLVGPLANVLGRENARRPTKDELNAGIETFGDVAKFAYDKDVKVAIEPLQWFEMPWPNTVEDVLAFIDYVERSTNAPKGVLGVLFDIYHALRMEETWLTALNLALNARKLFHVHIAGPNRTPPQIGQHIDWNAMIGTLKAAKWNGTITIESFGKECDLPFAVVGPGERLPAEEVIKTGVATLKAAGL